MSSGQSISLERRWFSPWMACSGWAANSTFIATRFRHGARVRLPACVGCSPGPTQLMRMPSEDAPNYANDVDAFEALIKSSTADDLGRLKADALWLVAEVRRLRALLGR